MKGVRQTAVAGTWYPDNRERLVEEIDAYLARVDVEAVARPLRAIVTPHAGLMYSGPVAAHAYAYARARANRCTSIVLVGPSHFVQFHGVSIWPDGAWDTPFGPVAVDRDLAHAISAESPDVIEMPDAHGREHSLEMQLPFIAHLFPGVPIVPLVMGRQTHDTAFSLAGAIARAVTGLAGDVLLVASSDLSHYENAATAAALDEVVIRHVETMDAQGLMAAFEAEPRHACGGGPMVAVLDAARQLGARESRLLQYADSGDVSGDKSSVVGYMAAAIW